MSPTGEFLQQAQEHLIQYMKEHREPIRTPELLQALRNTSPLPLTSSDNNITRDEAYRCMIVSERRKRTIMTTLDYYMVWHEYADDTTSYRGFVRD